MAVSRRMTRQVQIGLSHSEKAKKLSYNGFYEEALKELNIALRAFKSENRGGEWDDAIAGVLNNAGFVYLFIGNYSNAEDTFKSALAIKERLGDRRSLAATLAGLSDACKGLCHFEDSVSALEEALDITLALKDDGMARTLLASMDTLERARCDLPDIVCHSVDFDELYVPHEAADITARVMSIGVEALAPGELMIVADIGFPYLMSDLAGAGSPGLQPFPCLALLFQKGVKSEMAQPAITDEEEMAVGSSVSSFDGIIYAPGSYHRCGPQPMPSCKQYVYAYGAGHVVGWDLAANGWYHVEAALEVSSVPEMLRLGIAIPFGSVKLVSLSLATKEPDIWSTIKIRGGSFIQSRALDTSSAFSPGRMLYEGPMRDVAGIGKPISMKYGLLNIDLFKVL